jgi:AAA domain-containing protein
VTDQASWPRPRLEPDLADAIADIGRDLSQEEIAAYTEYEKALERWELVREYSGMIDLAELMEGESERPEMLVKDRLPVGQQVTLFGPYGQGKTWVALADAAEVIRSGRNVLWGDLEMGRRGTADRFKAIGLTPQEVREHLTYLEHPRLDGDPAMRALWQSVIDKHQPALVIIDAQTEAMAVAGLDDYRGIDVATWYGWYVAPVLEMSGTVELLDHVPHTGGRPIGAVHKANQARTMFEITTVQPFDRDHLGLLRMVRTKNSFDAPIPEEQLYELGGDGVGGFVFRATDRLVPDSKAAKAVGAQHEQNRVWAVVPADEADALSGNQVAQKTGLTRNKALKHLGDLVQMEWILTKDGPNRSVLHWRAPSV